MRRAAPLPVEAYCAVRHIEVESRSETLTAGWRSATRTFSVAAAHLRSRATRARIGLWAPGRGSGLRSGAKHWLPNAHARHRHGCVTAPACRPPGSMTGKVPTSVADAHRARRMRSSCGVAASDACNVSEIPLGRPTLGAIEPFSTLQSGQPPEPAPGRIRTARPTRMKAKRYEARQRGVTPRFATRFGGISA